MVVSPERHYAERVAMALESLGLPESYGKLLGYLLICDPPAQSSAELARALGLSKGSVSTGTRMLGNAGLVRRVPTHGQRGHSFEMVPDAFIRAADAGPTYARFIEVMEEGLALIGDEKAPRAQRLRQTRDFYRYIAARFPVLIEEFKAQYQEGEDDG